MKSYPRATAQYSRVLLTSSRLRQHCRLPTIFSFHIIFNCQSSSRWNWCNPLLLSMAYERLANVMTLQISRLTKSCLKLNPLRTMVTTRKEILRAAVTGFAIQHFISVFSFFSHSFIYFHSSSLPLSLSVVCFFISFNNLRSFLSSSSHTSFSFHFSSFCSFSHCFIQS